MRVRTDVFPTHRDRRNAALRGGFTLIELLVVIAIIGIMATFVALSFGETQQKSHDARRLSDINEISKVIAEYYDDNSKFPVLGTPGSPIEITGSDDLTTELQSVEPTFTSPADPLSPSATYKYEYYSETGADYTLLFCLETDKFPPNAKGCGNTSRGE